MIIIALWGKQNCGKSTAIQRFYDKYVAGNKAFDVVGAGPLPVEQGVVAIFNGKRIGIFSSGDNADCIQRGLENVGDCDIVICAARTKGGSVDAVEKETNQIVWIGKESLSAKDGTLSATQQEMIMRDQNEQAADRIFQALSLLCQ